MLDRRIAALDLGQARDPCAFAVVDKIDRPLVNHGPPETVYVCPYLRRWPLLTPYPAVIDDVAALMTTAELAGAALVVDYGGVGRPVVDEFRRLPELRGRVHAVQITGGSVANYTDDGHWNLPKKDLAAALQIVMQSRRFKVAADLDELSQFFKELRAFKIKVSSTTGHESFEGTRTDSHFDLVIAVALAVWFGEKHQESGDDSPFVLMAGKDLTGHTVRDGAHAPHGSRMEIYRQQNDPLRHLAPCSTVTFCRGVIKSISNGT